MYYPLLRVLLVHNEFALDMIRSSMYMRTAGVCYTYGLHMRVAMRERYGSRNADEKEEKQVKRGRGRPAKNNKSPLSSLPETRRNAIKAASVPDSDNRYEADVILCIPEFILGERYVDGVKSYKITWMGLDDTYCTWEPADPFDKIDAYKQLIDDWVDYKKETSYKVRKHYSKKSRARKWFDLLECIGRLLLHARHVVIQFSHDELLVATRANRR